MSLELSQPVAKVELQFPEGGSLTFWMRDITIHPPSMERDVIEEFKPGSPFRHFSAGVTRMTDGRIEGIISNSPEGYDQVIIGDFTSNTRREAENNLRRVRQLEQLRDGLQKRLEQLKKEKAEEQAKAETLRAEMEGRKEAFQAKLDAFPQYLSYVKPDFTPIIPAWEEAEEADRKWAEEHKEPVQLCWFERTAKRAIELIVDFCYWIW